MSSVISPAVAADPNATKSPTMIHRLLALLPVLCFSCLLQACMSGGAWKPDDRWPPKSPVHSRTGQYTVQPGETLYSIAWRYGMDYRQLAAINRIGPPYTIHVGQALNLSAPPLADNNEANATKGNNKASNKPAARSSSNGTGIAVIGGGTDSAASSPSYSAMKRSASPAPSRDVKVAGVPPAPPLAVPLVWMWPSDGKVIGRFSDGARVNKGIDIGGKLGDSVRSTRSGVVVYAGNGLAGYGNLVIIKHDDVYLSAYAHNKTILVREGQTVKAGDNIADIGSSGSAYPKLHFEIRRDGKPVNPLQLLPLR